MTERTERDSRYEGISLEEAEDIVEQFEQKMAEAAELLDSFGDSYLEACIIRRIQPNYEGDTYGSLPDQVRAQVLEDRS